MADQAINALPTQSAPKSSDQLVLVGAAEETLIDYEKLADAILNKLTSKTFTLDAGQKTIIQALNTLNSDNSINLLSVKEQDTFSNRLKERNYKMTVGYFYGPSDNPFSFNAGFYIAFNSIYLMEATQFLIIGFNTNGIMESKFVNFK